MRYIAVVVAGVLLVQTAPVRGDEVASADDTARFLAGMQPSAGSPLNQLMQDSAAKQHASFFDTAFGNLEKQQLEKVREWRSANITSSRPIMYYLFSGPDFLYANAFFPKASTYILSGLEPVGQVPDLMKLPRGLIAPTLRNIEVSLGSILSVSYFITANMRNDLNTGPVNGTLPILYVFLARSGKTIRDVSLVHLDDQGNLQSGDGLRANSTARGVKITFSGDDGQLKTLYYFSTSVADEPNGKYALLKFCRQHGQGDSFLKSASYLLHRASFSQARKFLLDQSALILQDDSGIPLASYEMGKWFLYPFGRYTGVLTIFEEHYQPGLTELYQRKQPDLINFGIGYPSRYSQSNLLLAIRNLGAPDVTSALPKNASRRREHERTGILKKPGFPARLLSSRNEDERGFY